MNSPSTNREQTINSRLTRNPEELYDEMLDDIYGTVQIAGFEYTTSRALKELDPIAYRCGLADWRDSLETDDANENEGEN